MMLKKWKGLLSFVICISILCTVMPITGYAEDNAVSVTFGGNTEYYTAIDAAWTAAVSLDTTAENKATIKLLADCTAENTLTNAEDYLVLDTNGRTLTTPDATYTQNNDVICGISAEGGSLEIIGNGTITGISSRHFARAILLISGGKVYADGVTIHNTGTTGSNAVLIKGGEFHLLNSYLISASEYALYADTTDSTVYLYSGKIESTGRAAMIAEKANVKICCSDKPLYFINNKPTKYWEIINDASYVHLEENARMDIEYSNNPDGSNSTLLENVTELTNAAILEKGYLKIQTSFTPSYLFDTRASNTLLSKIKTDGVTELDVGAFTAVHFVDLADYDMTNITYSDYSASGDGSVKAWVDGTELYIGGYGKIIAGESLMEAFRLGTNINAITGMEMLDTSNVTDMSYMFYKCGSDSTSFTLDLGDNFDTSNVTNASCMFWVCGENSPVFTLNLGNKFDTSKVIYMNNMFNFCGEKSNVFTLDLGDKFDTSNVKNMTNMFASCGKTSKVFTLDLGDKFHTENVTIGMNLMFYQCGQSSEVFKELDLSGFTISPELKNGLSGFVSNTPITKIIFGKGWRNAGLPTGGSSMSGLAYSSSKNNPIEIVGATKNLRSYDWAKDNRIVTFTDSITYTITAQASAGGTVTGGGAVLDGESITLTAAADNGYTFDGWYDGDTKVCETEEFVIEDAADDKTYTAKFTKDIVYYTVTAVAENGGTVTGGGAVLDGESITLTATADDGYTFDGWYDVETKVSETAEFAVENVTENKTYTAKFTKVVSRLLKTSLDFYGTNGGSYTLMNKVKDDGVTSLNINEFTAVHFVDLADYDMTNITYSDYSADGDGSVKAWVDGTELYIGGYGKIIAGDSIAAAFCGGRKIDSITGFEMLDTSNVTNMEGMFYGCGYNSTEFTLDLGDNFDTSKVTNMGCMFFECGYNSPVFTLDLGGKFDTSNVTGMEYMFWACGYKSLVFTLDLGDKFDTSKVGSMLDMFRECGYSSPVFTLDLGDKFDTSSSVGMLKMFKSCGRNSKVFTELDLSGFTFTFSEKKYFQEFAADIPVTKFIFGEGWANAPLPATGVFSSNNQTDTVVIGATPNLMAYDWAKDNRTVTFPDKKYYTVTAVAENGGTVTGGGTVLEGQSITLTATANDGYTFDGWYDGETKVSDAAEFTVENVTENKTYTAKFTKVVSRLLNTSWGLTKNKYTLFDKVKDDGVTSLNRNEFTAVHFVDLADYDMTNITYSDYSADGDGSVKAWVDGTELYIGGYGKIIAGDSLSGAFSDGSKIDSITGFEMLDTSNVIKMYGMFYCCGYRSKVFTLDLGDNFDTSNVTEMCFMFASCGYSSPVFTLDLGDKFDTSNVNCTEYMFRKCGYSSLVFTLDLGDKFNTSNVNYTHGMFWECGYSSPVFTLDLGDKFDTSNVKRMECMFKSCGRNSTVFTELDLSGFTFAFSETDYFKEFAADIPVTKFIFGEGWANAPLPTAGSSTGAFYTGTRTDTVVIGATPNLMAYNWAKDYRTVTFPDKKYYTVTAVAENGGTVTGGGTVLEGQSITLTAAASDGYIFDGWYDGETKVSDTAEFTVENVTADKTYTAKFAKNQVEPDPEPENPEIPYLKWDGTTLTLVKKEGASCRVGIVYVGGATFDAENIEWNELVAAGKEYANLNSSVGYAVYNNFTKRTPGTRGNYVAFVKYTKEDGTTTADYITYSVKDAVSFEIPGLSYNVKTKALQMKGNVESTVGVAYVGDTEFNAGDITWNDFVKAGKKYQDINGTGGYEKVLNTLDYTKTFKTNGNYVAFIKYFDENLNKTLAKYYAFNVADYDSQPTDAPFAVAEEKQIVLKSNGLDVAKVTIAYIGTDDIYITNWNDFSAAAAKFSDINGKSLNQQYANPKDGSAWKQETAGWYGVYIRYIKDGKTCNSYYTVELN